MTETGPARVAWVDASSGASGDMLLGALVGAGVPLGVLAEAVEKVVPGQVTPDRQPGHPRRVRRDPVRGRGRPTGRPERTWRDVEQLIGEAGLHEDVRSLAHDVFARLAEAEGRVHGVPAADGALPRGRRPGRDRRRGRRLRRRRPPRAPHARGLAGGPGGWLGGRASTAGCRSRPRRSSSCCAASRRTAARSDVGAVHARPAPPCWPRSPTPGGRSRRCR